MKKHLPILLAFLLSGLFMCAQSAQQPSSSKPAAQAQTNTAANGDNTAQAVPGSGAPSAMTAAPRAESMHRKAVAKAPGAANQRAADKGDHTAKPTTLKPVNSNTGSK